MKSIFFLSLAAWLWITGCSIKSDTSNQPAALNQPAMSQEDSRNTQTIVNCPETIKMTKGQNLILKLKATVGAGFLWELEKPATLLEQVKQDEIEYEPTPSSGGEPMVGGEKMQILRFKAVKTGKETIELVFWRPFDKNDAPNRCRFILTVD